MDRAALGVTLAGLALLLAPVVYFDELGVWGFSEPISNLDWDEGGLRPEQAGGTPAGSGGGSGSDPKQDEREEQGTGGGSGSGSDAGDGDGDGSDAGGGSGSGPGGSGQEGGSGSGGSGAALGVAGSGPGSGGNRTGSGAFGSTGSAPAFHWPSFAFGSLSFVVILGGCAWWWGNAYAAFWVAFAHAMAMWAVALCLALALLAYYLLWAYIGLLGGVVAAGLTLGLVYLHSQGALFGGTATGTAGPATPPAASGEPKAVQRVPKKPR